MRKIKVEKLYFARKGVVTNSTRTLNADFVFNPKDFVCCYIDKHNNYVDLFTGNVLKTFKDSKKIGAICINDIEPIKVIFDHPKIKVITRPQIRKTLKELDLPATSSKIGKCYVAVCKFNKITYREIFEHIKSCHHNNVEQELEKTDKTEMTM